MYSEDKEVFPFGTFSDSFLYVFPLIDFLKIIFNF